MRGNTMVVSSRNARKTYLRMVQSIQIISRLPKLTRIDDPLVTFFEEDARWLHYPHDNALVITLLITNFTT